MNERTRQIGGVALLLVGSVALYGLLELESTSAVVAGIVAVVLISLGTILLGTSRGGRPA
jgi:hypothetical protein